MNGSFEEQVRQRAYALWMDGGCVDGQALQHWSAAERELAATLKAGTKAASKRVRVVTKPLVVKPAATKPLAAKAGRAGARGKARPEAGASA